MKNHKKKIIRLCIAMLCMLMCFIICDILFPVRTNIAYSTQVLSSDSVLMHAFLSTDDKWRLKTELNEINPLIAKTLLYKEDKWFRYHPGINPIAIIRAAVNNSVVGKRTSGASTITMQVARLLYPAKRTYANKMYEMFRALQLEWHYTKDEILQMYINLVPYGSNIEGIKSASYIYFEKPPQQLSLSEITLLAIIPNKPTSLSGKSTNLLVQQRDKWLAKMKSDKLYSTQMIADAFAEKPVLIKHPLPKRLPHLSLRLKNENTQHDIIYTSINRNAQHSMETIIKNYVDKLTMLNITNAAVLINNNATGKIICYAGSADFDNSDAGGQVDGTLAIRSPGSTLKPLLYATAFDEGLLTPKTRIADVPMNVAGYIPENYDEKHNGFVTTEYALINSLNIPAVKTLNDVGLQTFIEKLSTCGFSSVRRNQKELGLSLILGGCGATLEQLVTMYSGIANKGIMRPLQYTSGSQMDASSRVTIMSSEAAYMVTDILSQMTRPDLPYNFQNAANKTKVAWKTGTSYGRRDAWCIGYNKLYTVGVWVGNFSGVGVPELSGAAVATPLMVELMNMLNYNRNAPWYSAPACLKVREVCSNTGMLPSEKCRDKTLDFYIPMVSNATKCNHTYTVAVTRDEKYSFCPQCLPANSSDYCYKDYDNPGAELQSFYDINNIPYHRQPYHNPACERVFDASAPLIVSPVNNMQYIMQNKDDNKMLLQTQVSADVQTIFWYINNKLYKSCKPDERLFFEPPPGNTKITCADDKGRNSTITINVKSLTGNL